jgi:L-fuculose-phosphate aldolase
MCVQKDGVIIGPHRPSIEYPFHRKIYELRPDFQAIVHAHPPALVSFSIVREVPDTRIIPQANRLCGPVGYAPYALPGSEQAGRQISPPPSPKVTTSSSWKITAWRRRANLLDAFHRLETLDFCARTLIRARALGE